MRITVEAFAKVVDAKNRPDVQGELTGLCIDSRKVKPGDLFVALKGEHADGHDYVQAALRAGATCALVETPYPGSVIVVDDCIAALAKWAAYHRKQWAGRLCAVTGSVGKTTTRAMIEAILSYHFGKDAVWATKGNLNNHLGVPLTMAGLSNAHQVCVLELGASGGGEIAGLTAMSQPDVGVITCVAPSHVEGFGSIEGIAKAKGELFEEMPPSAHAIVALDDEFAPLWLKQMAGRSYTTFGWHIDADMRVVDYEVQGEGMHVDAVYRATPFSFKIAGMGEHLLHNALAAMAACVAMGVPLQAVTQGIEHYHGVSGRLALRASVVQGVSVLDDAYNANPKSFAAAIAVLSAHDGPKLAAIGGMEELGEDSKRYHVELAQDLVEADVAHVFCLGKTAHPCFEHLGERASYFDDHQALFEALCAHLKPNTWVLVKGSRRWQMDQIVKKLTEKECAV